MWYFIRYDKHLSFIETFVLEVVAILSQNEKRVLDIIQADPFITQQDIADELDLNRSTVATLISGLVSKRIIKGRAYVVNKEPDIICIGGMNVDRKYVIQGNMVPETSNPVSSTLSIGGVGRNIAENLGRLEEEVTFLSVAGYDHDYEWIKEQTESFVNMDNITQLKDVSTGAYSAILDHEGEMQLALADMSINDQMDLAWIKQQIALLSAAKMIIIDLNLPKETVNYIIQLSKSKEIPLIVVPVSSPKMNRLPRDLQGVDTIIVNLDESMTFFDIPVDEDCDPDELIDLWLSTGIKQVVLTSGSRETLYGHHDGVRASFQPPQVPQVIDVTGAGDSFVGGFIFGQSQDYDYEDSVKLALTNSYHTIQSDQTVRLNLSRTTIIEEKNELF